MRKLERTKNAGRNIIFGIMLKVIQTVFPFVLRTVMIYFLGVEYLGLNSLFVSILQILNLAELGVGSAMVFSMYKPIAENDTKTICALMNLYKKYYRVIGLAVLTAGMVLCPFVPKLIKGSVPDDINIYTLYILNLGATVLSYWLFAYKVSIVIAHQRWDIISKASLITDTSMYILQIIVLVVFRNYYFYIILQLINQAVRNIFVAAIVDKMYPECKAMGKLPKETIRVINKRVRDLFTTKVGNVIVTFADAIVISAFLGLTALAVYQNYNYIMTAVMGFLTVIFTACTAGVGNSIVVESESKNYNDFKKFTYIIAWISGICTACFACLFQSFMRVWVGEKLVLGYSIVVCFCCYFFIYEINQLLSMYKDAAGIWHTDRFRPFVTAVVNLGLNIFLVNYWGIYGVILSTVISTLVVGMPWLLYNIFTALFRVNPWRYILKLFVYFLITFVVCAATYFVCSLFDLGGILDLVVKLVVCLVVSNALFFIIYSRFSEFAEAKLIFFRLLKIPGH